MHLTAVIGLAAAGMFITAATLLLVWFLYKLCWRWLPDRMTARAAANKAKEPADG